MCSISGYAEINGKLKNAENHIRISAELLKHRGPDATGVWANPDKSCVLAHNRLSIIDLNEQSAQPMHGMGGTTIVFNGEVYNFGKIKETIPHYNYRTKSDTEAILAAYNQYGYDCVNHLSGMFAFALWDENKKSLFCARDRFGIKPFYYAVIDGYLIFASEMKAIIPFLPSCETDSAALGEYLTFQYTIGQETLFKGIHQLMPGHVLLVVNGQLTIKKYWDVNYNIDHSLKIEDVSDRLEDLLQKSVDAHMISDVAVGSYLSGGLDSSLITALGSSHLSASFHGKFTDAPGYDESHYARSAASKADVPLHEITITAQGFIDVMPKVIYHLDTPVAGPGSFPQYMVSQLASQHVKVVLGGQGGDEIFGGYARYLIAYFEQSIKAAIEGTYKNGNFVVTPESIIPNLTLLQEYKPLLAEFWREGLFGPIDERYYRLIDRSTDMQGEIDWSFVNRENLMTRFKSIFNAHDHVRKEAYFDKMTRFDFKCLLPALLHVEDRMSMAHGIEARVPFLDHELVSFAATIPADIKFPGGRMKHLLKDTFSHNLPDDITQRRDKMGFPVPLKEWFSGPVKDFVCDVFSSQKARERGFYNTSKVLEGLSQNPRFSRKIWGILSLELWYQSFHDQQAEFRRKLLP